ncbi:MAG: class I SAM-dependent methyltransferase [Promethearchaeota archaeon]
MPKSMERPINDYNLFAQDYYNKRRRPWSLLIEFLKFLKTLKNNDKNVDIIINSFLDEEGVLIDLGSGTGRNIKILKEHSGVFIGADSSFESLLIARRSLSSSDNENRAKLITKSQFIACRIENLPIRDSSIDKATSIAAIHHIYPFFKRKKVLQSIYNILKRNSPLLITLWSPYRNHNNTEGPTKSGKKNRTRIKKINNPYLLKIKRNAFYNRTLPQNSKYIGNVRPYKSIKNSNPAKGTTVEYSKILLQKNDILLYWTISQAPVNIPIPRVYHMFNLNELQFFNRFFKLILLKKMASGSSTNNYFLFLQK